MTTIFNNEYLTTKVKQLEDWISEISRQIIAIKEDISAKGTHLHNHDEKFESIDSNVENLYKITTGLQRDLERELKKVGCEINSLLEHQNSLVSENECRLSDIKQLEEQIEDLKQGQRLIQDSIKNPDQDDQSDASAAINEQPNPFLILDTDKGDLLSYMSSDTFVEYKDCPNQGGHFEEPQLIVIHYTAGRGYEETQRWFLNPDSSVSAHILIGRDVEVGRNLVQLVPFNRRAWACGKSEWENRKSVNGFSISIELDNFGKLVSMKGHAGVFTNFGYRVKDNEIFVTENYGLWHKYTENQLQVCRWIVRALIDHYPTIKHVVGHSDISPGRKIDPGKAFPWQEFAKQVNRPEVKFAKG